MRLCWRRHLLFVIRIAIVLTFSCTTFLSAAQTAVLDGTGNQLVHIELLVPRANSKATVFVFEDLECPSCARADAYIHEAVKLYRVPVITYDYPLPNHPWAFSAAVIARYIQDQSDSNGTDAYRHDLFSIQWEIDSREDLYDFSRKWFASHKLKFPDSFDPSGSIAARIRTDINLGNRIGIVRTPTVIVVTANGWTQVVNVSKLGEVLNKALPEGTSGKKNSSHP
jgi:protein-disulfide isomerase